MADSASGAACSLSPLLQAIRISNGRSVFHQPDPTTPGGFLLPYRLISAAQAIPSMDHGWVAQHAAWNHGAMDNFVPAQRATAGSSFCPH
jgi:phospholipase C